MNKRRAPSVSDRPDRVLVIDDEPVIHELVREVLFPTDVISAMSVREAHAAVERREAFDVALVDKNLPDGSGIDLVRWLRTARPDSEIVMITAYPSMDSALEAMALGAMDYLIKPMRDINELRLRVGNACQRVRQRRAETALVAALRDSEEQYRELFEASPDAVLVLDAETREIVEANTAAERLYGRPRAELLGRSGTMLIASAYEPMLENGVIVRRDLRPDGTVIPVEVTTASAQRDGRAVVIEVIRDISERERAGAERADLEKRLSRASRLEALGRMAAGIAHDVNNMLCVIRTSNELVIDAVEQDAPARADLDQIEAAVASAADLTRRLLAFSGRQLIRAQVLDLNSLVHSVTRLLARTLEARARLELDLSPAPLFVLMDPGQLEQVIANLVVNARDAMPHGGQITIQSGLAERSSQVVLLIKDTGTGIPPEILGEIFEPFFTTKGTHGTGLGLATVHEIVTRAGGTIEVRSRVGEGTAFEIRLPFSNADPRSVTAAIATPIAAGRGETLLLVEDDVPVREVTRKMLVRGGYVVHAVGTAEEALEILATRTVLVLLTDVDLPTMSGTELARRVATEWAGVGVIFTSGMAADASAYDGRPFLAKPYTAEELLRAVRRVVDHR
ncbi:MAG: signal transduction histidine kinase, nitrogen specific, NtrB [Myxococcales bacterium]|nr:signal transduction histidine kinase, nitrogen specific, NtrB [Myxococcales bacterium]